MMKTKARISGSCQNNLAYTYMRIANLAYTIGVVNLDSFRIFSRLFKDFLKMQSDWLTRKKSI